MNVLGKMITVQVCSKCINRPPLQDRSEIEIRGPGGVDPAKNAALFRASQTKARERSKSVLKAVLNGQLIPNQFLNTMQSAQC